MKLEYFLVTEVAGSGSAIGHEATGDSSESSPAGPAVLGGLMVSENMDLNTVHARIRSGNFKLYPVKDAAEIAATIAALEEGAAEEPVAGGDDSGDSDAPVADLAGSGD
jgi:hypothetical protein